MNIELSIKIQWLKSCLKIKTFIFEGSSRVFHTKNKMNWFEVNRKCRLGKLQDIMSFDAQFHAWAGGIYLNTPWMVHKGNRPYIIFPFINILMKESKRQFIKKHFFWICKISFITYIMRIERQHMNLFVSGKKNYRFLLFSNRTIVDRKRLSADFPPFCEELNISDMSS